MVNKPIQITSQKQLLEVFGKPTLLDPNGLISGAMIAASMAKVQQADQMVSITGIKPGELAIVAASSKTGKSKLGVSVREVDFSRYDPDSPNYDPDPDGLTDEEQGPCPS